MVTYGGMSKQPVTVPTVCKPDSLIIMFLFIIIVNHLFVVSVSIVWRCGGQALWVRALAGDIVLCCWARHFTLTVPLSIQVYKWVPANLMLGVTLRWTSIPSRGK